MLRIPTISVIMPVYNCAEYVAEAIQSILDQTFADFELIIIDDKSSDKTREVIESFSDKRINVIKKPGNTGISDSLNKVIDLARGEFIARMDGDDISMPQRFEKQVSFMVNNPQVVVCGTSYKLIGTDKAIIHPLNHEDLKISFLRGCYLAHPSSMIRSKVLKNENVRYDPSTEPAEDYDLWVRLLNHGEIANLEDVLIGYRLHEQQISFQKATPQFQQSDKVRLSVLKILMGPDKLTPTNIARHLALMKADCSGGFSPENMTEWVNMLLEENTSRLFFNQLKLRAFLYNLADEYNKKYFLHAGNPGPGLLYKLYRGGHYTKFTFAETLRFSIRATIKRGFVEAVHPGKLVCKILARMERKKKEFLLSPFGSAVINSYNIYLNPVTRFQRKNIRSIPIIINNYNQLSSLVKLISDLKERGYHNIFILDNNSSYQPLLAFYKITNAKVIKLDDNYGHTALWKKKKLFRRFSTGYYVLTDPDIGINEKCPADFLGHFINLLEKHPMLSKVGFALKIDDLPDYYPLKRQVINWENQFWHNQIRKNEFLAIIDTTFALYRPFAPLEDRFSAAIRLAGNFTARHEGWYKNPLNPTEEEKQYMATANNSSTWVLDEQQKTRKNAEKYM